jgi:hypothetical protein
VATLGTIGTIKMTPYKFSQFPNYITKRPWFLKSKTLMLYMYLLSNKSYLEKTLINNIPLLKDQLLTSSNSLEKALKLTKAEITTAIKNLKATNDIAIKGTNKYSIITLLFEKDKNKEQETGDEALGKLTLQEDKKQKQGAKNKNKEQNKEQETGDEALGKLTLEDPSKTKTRSKTRTILEQEDKNINIKVISENDFQEWWKNYPVQNTKVKGDKEATKKEYNSLRKKGITKEEVNMALEFYKEELKINSWQQSKRAEGWLKKWETYKQEDYSKEIKEIKAKIIAIEPETTITVENKRIIIVLPTFDKLRACKTKINNDINPLCKEIGYQLFITTQND